MKPEPSMVAVSYPESATQLRHTEVMVRPGVSKALFAVLAGDILCAITVSVNGAFEEIQKEHGEPAADEFLALFEKHAKGNGVAKSYVGMNAALSRDLVEKLTQKRRGAE